MAKTTVCPVCGWPPNVEERDDPAISATWPVCQGCGVARRWTNGFAAPPFPTAERETLETDVETLNDLSQMVTDARNDGDEEIFVRTEDLAILLSSVRAALAREEKQ